MNSLQHSGYGGSLNLVYSGLDYTYKVEGLATGYTYRVEIRARNIAGEGSGSSLSAITCDTPPAVDNFRVTSRS